MIKLLESVRAALLDKPLRFAHQRLIAVWYDLNAPAVITALKITEAVADENSGFMLVKGWQKIETAPTDGSWVLGVIQGNISWDDVYDPFAPVSVRWDMEGWIDDNINYYKDLTHWMPIPEIGNKAMTQAESTEDLIKEICDGT